MLIATFLFWGGLSAIIIISCRIFLETLAPEFIWLFVVFTSTCLFIIAEFSFKKLDSIEIKPGQSPKFIQFVKRNSLDPVDWKVFIITLYIIVVAVNNFGNKGFPIFLNMQFMFEIQEECYEEFKKTNRIEKTRISEILESRSWYFNRWPYQGHVSGSLFNWTVTFKPRPLTFAERAIRALFYWNFNPQKSGEVSIETQKALFEIKSECLSIHDGRLFAFCAEDK